MLQGKAQNKISKLSYTAVFLAFSVIISIVEGMFPLTALIPLPGVRIGLCNIAITAALYILDVPCAAAVVIVRPLFLFLFGGNVFSLAMSLFASSVSFLSLLATKRLHGKVFSFIGISAFSAVCHSVGQTICGALIMGSAAIFSYLPVFAAASCLAGSLCGAVMNIVIPRMAGIKGKKAGSDL